MHWPPESKPVLQTRSSVSIPPNESGSLQREGKNIIGSCVALDRPLGLRTHDPGFIPMVEVDCEGPISGPRSLLEHTQLRP